jgi:hypothetical protein
MPIRKHEVNSGVPQILHVRAGSSARNGAVTDLSRSSQLFMVALRLAV